MSDDPQPPDLTETTDLPRDRAIPLTVGDTETDPDEATDAQTVPAASETAVVAGLFGPEPTEQDPPTIDTAAVNRSAVLEDGDAVQSDGAGLFSNATSVRLSVGDATILEDEARPTVGPVPGAELPTERFSSVRALWDNNHERGLPFYRRQGPVAGAGLLILLVVGALSFPWTRATIESGVVTLIDDSADTAAAGQDSGSRDEIIEGPSSGSMVLGDKNDTQDGSLLGEGQQAEGLAATSSQIASTANATPTTGAPVRQRQTPPVANHGPVLPDATTTSVLVAPIQLACEDPAAIPPACTTTTTVPTTTTTELPAQLIGETTTTEVTTTTEPELEITTTTEPEPTTTEAPPTTRPRRTTTTTVQVTTTTTEPDEEPTTTTTTTEPDEEPTTTTTTEPDEEPTTTTTTEPDEEPTTTTTTEPDEEPTTTTTTEPDEEPTTTTTEPDEEPTTTTTTEPDDTIPDTTEPPIEDELGGSGPTIVVCTPTTQPGVEDEDQPSRTLC